MKPPLLPSVGQTIPRTWLQAMAFLRSLRDGRDPVAAARSAVPTAAEVERMERGAIDPNDLGGTGSGFAGGARPYTTMVEAEHIWLTEVVPALDVEADAEVLHDALQLLVNQGEVFSSSGIIYLQPDYITRLLKPLVDHRLTRSRFQQTLGALPGDADTQQRRASLLLPACETFVRTGELREELLLPMWQPLGLHGDDYGDVMVMLSASGVVFLAQHESHGRRWVMPMRLPEARPAEAYEQWQAMLGEPEMEHLAVGYRLGRFAPPGLSERLTAACKGLGEYSAFWKRGAILNTPIPHSQMLLEMRTAMVSGETSGSTHATHELCISLRGPHAQRSQMWLLLLRVQEVTERLLDDFPGIYPDGVAYCPGCAAKEDFSNKPMSWPLADVCSKHIKCSQCEEALALHIVKLSKESAVVDLFSPGLFVTPPQMVITESADGGEDSARRSAARRVSGDSVRGSDSFRSGGDSFRSSGGDSNDGSPLKRQSSASLLSLPGVVPETSAKAAGAPSPPKVGGSPKIVAAGGSPKLAAASADGYEGGDDDEPSTLTRRRSSVALPTSLAAELPTLTETAKFVSRQIRFGRPIEAGVGLHKLLGLVSEEDMAALMKAGETAIITEISNLNSAERDAAGYTDTDWLNYIKDQPAEEKKLPAGMPSTVLDEGHQLMRLDDFVSHATAADAGLKRPHVIALRLYTASVHRTINKHLLDGCSPERPHPYPATVAYICDALKRLRGAAEQQARADAKAAATGANVGKAAGALLAFVGKEKDKAAASTLAAAATGVVNPALTPWSTTAGGLVEDQVTTLWRGVGDLHGIHELKSRGGTELGFVSASPSRAVAEEYCVRATQEGAPLSLLLKVRADVLNGTDLSFLSLFPYESECVYPPATFFEARSSWDERVELPSGEVAAVKVVEVVPRPTGSGI